MNWRLKAKIQNAVCLLPDRLSYAAYYWIQRHFGGLKLVSPINRLSAGIEVCKRIVKLGRTPVGSTFLEIGTGRRINMPLAFWFLGAEKIMTVDLNPYLKEELVREDIEYIRKNLKEVEEIFNGCIYNSRLDKLLKFTNNKWRLFDLLQLCNIDYIAPRDAAKLPISPNSVDFHTSYTVFEHIPVDILKAILKEGNRIINSKGLFIHRIDYSDHFSQSDGGITSINFLQFSDNTWNRIAGNRYMYMNRLRIDDFQDLFQASDHRVLISEPTIDASVYELLRSGSLDINDRFAGKSEEILATTGSWIVTEKRS